MRLTIDHPRHPAGSGNLLNFTLSASLIFTEVVVTFDDFTRGLPPVVATEAGREEVALTSLSDDSHHSSSSPSSGHSSSSPSSPSSSGSGSSSGGGRSCLGGTLSLSDSFLGCLVDLDLELELAAARPPAEGLGFLSSPEPSPPTSNPVLLWDMLMRVTSLSNLSSRRLNRSSSLWALCEPMRLETGRPTTQAGPVSSLLY